MNSKKILFVLLLSMITACTATSGNIKIAIQDVNVYHIPNEKTCSLVEQYVKDNSKLQAFYSKKQDGGFHCEPSQFTLHITLGSNISTLSITEYTDNSVRLRISLNYTHQFTYQKDGITKDAAMIIHQQIQEADSKLYNQANTITLLAGGTTFDLQYDDINRVFYSNQSVSKKDEIRFTEDLQEQLIAFYTTAKTTFIDDSEVMQMKQDLIRLIDQTADQTSSDITMTKTINEIEFDHIYPFMNYLTDKGIQQYAVVPGFYTVEKDGKYGLVNNNGLLVVEMEQDNNIYLFDTNDLFFLNREGIGIIPFTTYLYGAGRGFGYKSFYMDRKKNQVIIENFGHEGPSSNTIYHKELFQLEEDLLLPYRTVDACNFINPYTCEFVNSSSHLGLMDIDGTPVTDPLFDEVFVTNTPLIAVKKDDLWGYVDRQGQQIIDFLYEAVIPTHDGKLFPYPPIGDFVIVKNTAGKFGVLDLLGEILIPFEYDWIAPYFGEQFIVQKDGKWSARKLR